MSDNRISWNDYFISMALITSLRSNCCRRKVGCILTRNNKIISTGMNGTPSGMKNCYEKGCPRCNDENVSSGTYLSECFCLHAEENALLYSNGNYENCVLYCTTFPCLSCSKKIIQCKIKKIYYIEDYNANKSSIEILNSAGLQYEKILVNKTPIIHRLNEIIQ